MTHQEKDTRNYWLSILLRIAAPVLNSLEKRVLKEAMPRLHANEKDYAPLEALGRLLAGIAPWLELGPADTAEGQLRKEFCEKARLAIDAGTDPSSSDFMNFTDGLQPLVDTAFLAQALLRAPNELWSKLDGRVKQNVIRAFQTTKDRRPSFSNWLMFGAITETALYRLGEAWDPMRVDYALRQHEQWYLGDGVYGDGPDFSWDFYNSFVIHPMLIDVLRNIEPLSGWAEMRGPAVRRSQRLAVVLERLISPEGTVPPLGRSLAYRFGLFHSLSQMALLHKLPNGVSPAQVRCGMTSVLRRMTESPGTFDSKGWLRPGFCGFQPSLAESYITTGSLYLCSVGLLPLGLGPEDEFWCGAPQEWTSCKIWSGVDIAADQALEKEVPVPREASPLLAGKLPLAPEPVLANNLSA